MTDEVSRVEDRMRFLLQKASRIIDLIASGEVPLGTAATVKLIDSLDEELGYEQEEQDEDDELQEVKDDRYSLINLYAAVKKEPGFLPLYTEIGKVLRKYGLFDEEVVLLENAVNEGYFKEEDKTDSRRGVALDTAGIQVDTVPAAGIRIYHVQVRLSEAVHHGH